METKQHDTKKPMGQQENQKGKREEGGGEKEQEKELIIYCAVVYIQFSIFIHFQFSLQFFY